MLASRLKSIDGLIRNTTQAKNTLVKYETRLQDVQQVPADEKELQEHQKMLKVFLLLRIHFRLDAASSSGSTVMTLLFCSQSMLAEAEGDQAEFHRLQEDLRHASVINEKMRRIHGEHDAQLELYRQLVENLLERWQAVFAQLDLRQQELNLLGRHMKSYGGSYDWLLRWLTEARQRQENLQALPLGHGSVLNQQLAEGKVGGSRAELNRGGFCAMN